MLSNWKLGHDKRGASLNKALKLNVVTKCYKTYCRSLFKQTKSSGGYYLYMASNGYIYETSSNSSEDRYFYYSYSSQKGRCVWSSKVIKGSYITHTNIRGENFYVIGSDTGSVVKFEFI